MNKVFLAIVVAFIMFFSFVQVNAQVTCPPGMNGPITITYNWTPSCPITIIYCWSLSPGGILTTRVEWIGGSYNPPCLQGFLNDPDRDGILMTEIARDLGTNGRGPAGSNPVPPCSTNSVITFELEQVQCNYLENDVVNQTMWLKPCLLPGVCRKNFKVCIDFTQTPPQPIITYLGATLGGGTNCPDTFPTLPDPMPAGWQSNCFMRPCQ